MWSLQGSQKIKKYLRQALAGPAVSCDNVGTGSGQVEETSALSSAQAGTPGKLGRIPGWDSSLFLQLGHFTGVCVPVISGTSAVGWLHLQIGWGKWW